MNSVPHTCLDLEKTLDEVDFVAASREAFGVVQNCLLKLSGCREIAVFNLGSRFVEGDIADSMEKPFAVDQATLRSEGLPCLKARLQSSSFQLPLR